jgi:hypothetical protein
LRVLVRPPWVLVL